ncbi:outer membrane protein A precursor [Buchnera aphidicola (Cinara tujafilina)]|uniref:Outer membrane protein A n=1 Tax=Buchnera aphidicola (Cinara tujafilina) TaxID=261317 RepID=F7WZD8_9GAMM|nr:outer membrane protein A [Buchnera aphidicola]AEH39800.1 outer membrane protein A precursor [Buchnera aphidicola (Cinara tujafilina)]
MVKLVFAFAMLFSSLINTNTHASIFDKHKWYVGITSGTMDFKDLFYKYQNIYQNAYRDIVQSMIQINSSMFFGYKINPYINLEVLSRIAGQVPDTLKFTKPKILFADIAYTTKFILPVTKKLSLYTKLGAIITNKKIEKLSSNVRILENENRVVAPFFSSGIQCFLNNKVFIDFGYQVKKSIFNLFNLNTYSMLEGLNFNISWRFGDN